MALDIYPSPDGMNDWIEYWHSKKGGNVTWGLDGDGSVARKYEVVFLGQTVVINRSGNVVYNGGPLNYDSLVKLVEES
ncbi:MAG: hypothetical protein V3T49_09925 [Dehalococcoidia bacterium]